MKWKRWIWFGIGIGILSVLLGGCDRERTEKMVELAAASYPEEPVFKNTDEEWEYSRARRTALTDPFCRAYENFAINTAAELFKGTDENQVYCPLSLYYALALAADGAAGETQEEMLQMLGFSDCESLAEECKNSFEALYHVPNEENMKPNEWGEYSQSSLYQLRIANSVWADDSIAVKTSFADRGAEYFYADIFQTDLQAEETGALRSQWVKERTNGLITPGEEPADDLSLLAIMNTVYFYDEWINRFDVEKTKQDRFFCADGTEAICNFMNMEMGSHGFRKGENYTESSLSLKNGTMTFYLPDEDVSVGEMVKDAETLEHILNSEMDFQSGQVIWKVPKFTYGSHMNLSDMLKAVGMEQAFSEQADFSNMSDDSTMFISSVIQDANLGIDENGVEGAAYTEIQYAGAAMPTGRAEMILNRPFLFTVKNNGILLFVGICQNPAE